MAKIRATKQIALDDIHVHPENPNQGDAGAISLSLQHHGQFRAIVVSEATGNILAGTSTPGITNLGAIWTQHHAIYLHKPVATRQKSPGIIVILPHHQRSITPRDLAQLSQSFLSLAFRQVQGLGQDS